MRHLDDAQFHATFSLKMRNVKPDSAAMADVLPSVQAIPPIHLQGFELGELCVERVYRGDSGLFEHYMVCTTTANVYLVLVRDRVEQLFLGYHALDLNAKYGLPTPSPGAPAARR